jgi:Fic family protein
MFQQAGFIYDLPEWPHFTVNEALLERDLAELDSAAAGFRARLSSLGAGIRRDINGIAVFDELRCSFGIEGISLDPVKLRSSLARKLDIGFFQPAEDESRDRYFDGLVDIFADIHANSAEPLSEARLFRWHRSLFRGDEAVRIGEWRHASDGHMLVVSGSPGDETVHFQAVHAARVPGEMDGFIAWFNAASGMHPVVKAAVAHLWFVTVHPFADGNGRIARALSDLAAAAHDNAALYYSLNSGFF